MHIWKRERVYQAVSVRRGRMAEARRRMRPGQPAGSPQLQRIPQSPALVRDEQAAGAGGHSEDEFRRRNRFVRADRHSVRVRRQAKAELQA